MIAREVAKTDWDPTNQACWGLKRPEITSKTSLCAIRTCFSSVQKLFYELLGQLGHHNSVQCLDLQLEGFCAGGGSGNEEAMCYPNKQ
mmetsp:Transcript_13696/g.31589  ORF Transcript_13696/g.31589 Transcript_13696/m.31589 type:complete len:88 (+) Transcript_13696:136-399(+)